MRKFFLNIDSRINRVLNYNILLETCTWKLNSYLIENMYHQYGLHRKDNWGVPPECAPTCLLTPT